MVNMCQWIDESVFGQGSGLRQVLPSQPTPDVLAVVDEGARIPPDGIDFDVKPEY